MRDLRLAGLAALLLLGAGATLAQPLTLGPTSKLTDETCEDGPAAVAMRPEGSFLVLLYSSCAERVGLAAQLFTAQSRPAAPRHAIDPRLVYGANLASLGSGGYLLAAWTSLPSGEFAILGQFLDPEGQPLGAPRVLSDATAQEPVSNWSRAGVGVDAVGNISIVWQTVPGAGGPSAPNAVRIRRFAPDATPLAASIAVEPAPGIDQSGAILSVQPDGSALVTWLATPAGGRPSLRARRIAADGQPMDSSILINRPDGPADLLWALSRPTADGGFTVGWIARVSLQQPAKSLHLRHLSALGELLPETSSDSGDPSYDFSFDLAPAGGSQLFLVQGSTAIGFTVSLVSFDGTPATDPQSVVPAWAGLPAGPRIAANPNGEAILAWAGDAQTVAFPVGNVVMGYDVLVRPLRLPCAAGGAALCLGADDRFRATLSWTSPQGAAAIATPIRLSAESGGFWFFSPSNAELLVKVLDGRSLNRHFWVLFGGMTDLAFTLRIADAQSGTTAFYTSPRGALASRADTMAFADPGTPRLSGAAAPSTAHAAGPENAPSSCGENAAELCLRGRFRVAIAWHDATGHDGIARPLAATAESGVAWFFDPDNPEVSLKLLDGGPLNGSFWLFVASLTNQAFDLTLTDTLSGRARTYQNPAGRMRSFADLKALPSD